MSLTQVRVEGGSEHAGRTLRVRRRVLVAALFLAAAITACDKDPNGVDTVFALNACPTAGADVNSPLVFNFSGAVLPSTVTPANIVVSDAVTGLELPGSVALQASGNSVVFTPSAPLPFDTIVRVRIQNLRSSETNNALTVTVCEFRTAPPPITQLFWDRLPSAGGSQLRGVSLVEPDLGYVMSRTITLYRREGETEFTPRSLPAQTQAGYDVAFLTRDRGFFDVLDFRRQIALILETNDGGLTFDSLAAVPAPGSTTLERIIFRSIGPNRQDLFGAGGGGSNTQARFTKYSSLTGNATTVQTFGGTGRVHDMDFAADTLLGAAVSEGVDIVAPETFGMVFVSSNGGSSWSVVPGLTASEDVQRYHGVAILANGTIFVTGGSGFAAKLTPDGSGGYTTTPILVDALTNPDPTDELALIYNDVQFAPDGLKGWIVGAQQVGLVNGVPRYQGVIFETTDGGTTWTRQGVRGAEAFGASFPALNRISALSATDAWIVGDAGTVLRYNNDNAP